MEEWLSKHFKRSDFSCNGTDCCEHSAPIDMRLVEGLQALRDMAGKPIHLSCGFRCRKHNREVGGTANSYHIKGMAADIQTPEGMTPKELVKLAESISVFNDGGIGIYSWGIHVDVRGFKARW